MVWVLLPQHYSFAGQRNRGRSSLASPHSGHQQAPASTRGHERAFCPAPTRENRGPPSRAPGPATGTCPPARRRARPEGGACPPAQPGRPQHRRCPGTPQPHPELLPGTRPRSVAAGPSRRSRPTGASPADTAAREPRGVTGTGRDTRSAPPAPRPRRGSPRQAGGQEGPPRARLVTGARRLGGAGIGGSEPLPGRRPVLTGERAAASPWKRAGGSTRRRREARAARGGSDVTQPPGRGGAREALGVSAAAPGAERRGAAGPARAGGGEGEEAPAPAPAEGCPPCWLPEEPRPAPARSPRRLGAVPLSAASGLSTEGLIREPGHFSGLLNAVRAYGQGSV